MKALSTLALLVLCTVLTFGQENGTDHEVLTLDKAVDIALRQNPDLVASRANVDAIEARVKNAKSGYYPKIEFRFIIPFVERESGVFADQLIYDFGRTSNLVKASRANLRSTEFDKQSKQEEVILNTRKAYYTALAEKWRTRAAQQKVSEREKLLAQAEGFLEAGRISEIELAGSRVDLGNAKLELINAKHDLEIARMELSTVMGIEGDLGYELADMLEYSEAHVNLEEAISEALSNRPEIKSIKAKKVAMRAEVTASKRDLYFPTVVGRAAYRFEGEGATGPDFIAGIGLRYDIFEGFSDLANVNKARANLRRSEAETEALKQEVRSEVKRLYLNLKSAEEKVEVTRQSKESAKENLELASERYQLGVGSSVELEQSRSLSASTEADYARAVYNYKIAIAKLERAVGENIIDETYE